MTRTHRTTSLLVAGATLVAGVLLTTPAAAGVRPAATVEDDLGWSGEAADDAARGRPGPPTRYTNPLAQGVADTFADPAVVRGKDGAWYAYGTTDPLLEGEGVRHLLPILRSTDLVTWVHVGDAFTEDTLPAWADTTRGAALWAPDVRYVDGEYRLYYVVTDTTVTDEPNDNAIGVATAPSPTGPWTDSGAPVVEPRRGQGGPGDFRWTFDPAHVTDVDGGEHLVYGSYYGGLWVTDLSDDGRTAVGEPVQIAIDNKYEGAYVVRRDGFWYLFASSANCCAGPVTGYSVHVGRSESLEGPYVDREGVPLLQSRAGGTPVIAPNGNRWVGTGHNAVVTDLAGQDWLVYHAIDRADPYLDGTDGINERPMLMDRLDWVDGWPTVRGGAWASQEAQVGPVVAGRFVTTFADGVGRDWRTGGAWTTRTDADAGSHAASERAGTLTTRRAVAQPVRVEADVRLGAGVTATSGLVAAARASGDQVRALLDPVAGELRVEVVARRGARSQVVASGAAPLPAGFAAEAWHAVVLEVADGAVHAEVSHARLGDPFAVVDVALPARTRTAGAAGALAGGAGVHVDNLGVLPMTPPETAVVEPPLPGVPDEEATDEFDGTSLDPGWTVLRDPDVTVSGGVLRWPTEAADLVGTGPGANTAGVLLRDAPDGDWTAETAVTVDLGTDTVRNFQQAGIVAYVDDDLFARLSHVAIWNTRQTEFGYEAPFAGRVLYGGTIVGPPSGTTWLRLTRTTDEVGEQEVRASTSTDGVTWVHGGVWTFPADAEVRIGLVAHGGAGATAEFDHLRVYQNRTR